MPDSHPPPRGTVSSDNIIDIPTKGLPFKQVTADEIWASPEPSELMIHAICPYLRNLERCQGCVSGGEDLGHYGKGTAGCYVMAGEVCRIVMAVQRREAP